MVKEAGKYTLKIIWVEQDLEDTPDTNSPGTAGCIGFRCSEEKLNQLGDFFNNYIKDGKTMKFNFQIPNNPNYGNHGKANKSIGQ